MIQTKVVDIHNYSRRLRREERLLKKSEICEENKELILRFAKELKASGISDARILRYMQTLRKISSIANKPFTEWGRDELVEVLRFIESNDYAVQTKNEFRKGVRRIFKWLKGENWEGLRILRGFIHQWYFRFYSQSSSYCNLLTTA